jgi:hypothetical protein
VKDLGFKSGGEENVGRPMPITWLSRSFYVQNVSITAGTTEGAAGDILCRWLFIGTIGVGYKLGSPSIRLLA